MRNKIFAIFLFSALLCFGRASMADSFCAFRTWLYPAYLTCLLLGISIFAVLSFLAWRYKTPIDSLLAKASDYLRSHWFAGVLVAGVLLAIPLGLALSVLWQLVWLAAFFVFVGIFLLLPVVVAIGRFRNKFLLNKKTLKWGLMLAVSSVLASAIFVALIEIDLLSFSNDCYWGRTHSGIYLPAHPWDSLEVIWSEAWLLTVSTVVSILLVMIGKGIGMVYRKIKRTSHTDAPTASNPQP